jgi:hypothetical protein
MDAVGKKKINPCRESKADCLDHRPLLHRLNCASSQLLIFEVKKHYIRSRVIVKLRKLLGRSNKSISVPSAPSPV